MAYLEKEFFARDTVTVARGLVGTTLVIGKCEGRIVETEAYTTDAASHAVTRRNQAASMTDTYGHIYVYFTYGMYYCLNFTTERNGTGAVLIRAAEPLKGIEEMSRRRETPRLKNLASGPGKLCQAFGIDLALNGKEIGKELRLRERTSDPSISSSVRIGISRATHLEWRFYEDGSPFVSTHPKTVRAERAAV
ncbi:MAG: DNA-3-methyladenine glycosylase [Blastocatellia bacterium]